MAGKLFFSMHFRTHFSEKAVHKGEGGGGIPDIQ